MKSCSEMRHLEQFGIKPLTGEADALGFRILCDLDIQGIKVFKECFGMPLYAHPDMDDIHFGLAENWNSGSRASVMLTGHDIVPLAIMGFYLQGHNVIVTRDEHNHQNVYAMENDEAIALNDAGDGYKYFRSDYPEGQDWPSCYGRIVQILRQRKSDGHRVVGTRNVHQMSGRVS